jgi:hypothetical protein
MGMGVLLEFYERDAYASYQDAKARGGLESVYLDYADDKDVLDQGPVYDAIEIINKTLKIAGRQDVKLAYILIRDGVILDC